jgi:hypothetical protein
MSIFAFFRRWTRIKADSCAGEAPPVQDTGEDHSSMADFVRVLTRTDLTETSRTQR